MPASRKLQTAWDRTLKSFAIGCGVFFLGSLMASLLTRYDIHGLLALTDNLLTGIVAGLLVFLHQRGQHNGVEKKLKTIRLMNHHVRNALQVISAASSGFEDIEQSAKIRDAVRRIEWALREVLPGENDVGEALVPPHSEASKTEFVA